jgi:hypothetical protein
VERTSESEWVVIFLRGSSSCVGMGLEIQLAAAPIGYVGVELGRREVGMAEHFLDAP